MLPLDFPSADAIAARGYGWDAVRIWHDAPRALNMGRELPPELARYLGAKHRLGLFRSDPARRRRVVSAHAPPPVATIDFHDSYPVHLLSLASVRQLESKMHKDAAIQRLDLRRFRANVIAPVSGAEPYDEDDWTSVRFGRRAGHPGLEPSLAWHVCCRTTRCKLPNVDPATGHCHKTEPDRALRKYRAIDRGAPNTGCLGMQLCPVLPPPGALEQPPPVLEVGMEIEVLQRGPHFFLAHPPDSGETSHTVVHGEDGTSPPTYSFDQKSERS